MHNYQKIIYRMWNLFFHSKIVWKYPSVNSVTAEQIIFTLMAMYLLYTYLIIYKGLILNALQTRYIYKNLNFTLLEAVSSTISSVWKLCYYLHFESKPSKHETLTQCWFNVDPLSTKLSQHWVNISGLLGRYANLANIMRISSYFLFFLNDK